MTTAVKKDRIRDIAKAAFEAMEDTKVENPLVFDLRKNSSIADFILIGTVTSTTQAQAMADKIEESIKKQFARRPLSIEGAGGTNWVLLDYGDIVCHIFLEAARDFYRLEDMWFDAKQVEFGAKKAPAVKKTVTKKAPAKKPAAKKTAVKKVKH